MLVKRLEDAYEFSSITNDGAFMISLMLKDDGAETLYTMPLGCKIGYAPLELKKGTIKKTIGKKRWANFLHMKEMDVMTMFIDRHSKE
ncbi:MAG TPA: hypothetical protein PKM88_03275 [bacterium]|nr:hypothetical protein [bacterium]